MAPRRVGPPADPNRFEEAIQSWRRRVPMTDPEFRDLDDAERERAFWVAGVAQADIVQEAFDAIDRAISDGTTLEDFKASVGEALEGSWGGEDAARLETVFRTNVMSAYNDGRYTLMTAPVVKEARSWWRFDGVEDDRQSEVCSEIDGTVLPADDPFWASHHPPLHMNCRSVITPLSDEEAQDEGIDDEAPDPEASPAEGFGAAPSEEGQDWEPDLTQFDEQIAAVLKDKLAL